MSRYVLYTTRCKEALFEKINTYDTLSENDYEITINKEENVYVFEIYFKKDSTSQAEILANIVSDIVQYEIVYELAHKYIDSIKDMYQINREEVKKIFILNNYLSKEEGSSYISYYLIYLPILEQIKTCRTMNIEGWMQFRTKEYRIILKDILKKLIVQQQMKENFQSFIKFIKEISLLKESIEEETHIIYRNNHQVKILNTNKQDITKACEDKYCKDFSKDYKIGTEEMVMNLCITLSPHRIIIHQKHNCKKQQFFRTLERIFEDKIIYCKGCALCQEDKEFTDR